MDPNYKATPNFTNPYAKRSVAEEVKNDDVPNDVAINTVVADLTMGIQSQLREGAVKKCKKIGTKVKSKRVYRQNAIGGGVAFVETLHCGVCKARHLSLRGKNVNIPHRSHHKNCSMNRKTKGLSAMTVFVNKQAARNIAINNAPINSVLGR